MNLFNFDAFGPGVGYLLVGFAILFLIVGVIVVLRSFSRKRKK